MRRAALLLALCVLHALATRALAVPAAARRDGGGAPVPPALLRHALALRLRQLPAGGGGEAAEARMRLGLARMLPGRAGAEARGGGAQGAGGHARWRCIMLGASAVRAVPSAQRRSPRGGEGGREGGREGGTTDEGGRGEGKGVGAPAAPWRVALFPGGCSAACWGVTARAQVLGVWGR